MQESRVSFEWESEQLGWHSGWDRYRYMATELRMQVLTKMPKQFPDFRNKTVHFGGLGPLFRTLWRALG